MVLTNVGNNAVSVSGPGEIWQDEDGVLQFKIFIGMKACQDMRNQMLQPRTIGQLIPDGDYFTLKAQEYTSATRWGAQRVMPNSRSGLSGALAYGHLQEMMHFETIPKTGFDFVLLRLKGKIPFPGNQAIQTVIRIGGEDRRFSNDYNAAFIDDNDHKFEVLHEGEHTVVSLQLPAGGLNDTTPSRVHEALQFVLGRQLAVVGIETGSAGGSTKRLISPIAGNGKVAPPLMFDSSKHLDQGEHIWRLFVTYFCYIQKNTADNLHPISRHISSILESMAGSLDVGILALAVAVEGIVADCFQSLGQVNKDFLMELDAVRGALNGLKLTPASKKRLEGSIMGMRRPRNSDLVKAFLHAHHLPDGLYESWSRLRNTSAHGGGLGNRDIETVLKLRNEVLCLLYSLVFAAINYTGKHSDYSLSGWPTVMWPVLGHNNAGKGH